jgi:microcystin-dependent protein
MAGAVDTTYTFTATDVITSTKMNNIIDETVMTTDAIIGSTLAVSTGKLRVNTSGITANELATGSVTTTAILDASVTQPKLSPSLLSFLAFPSGAIIPFAMSSAPTGWLEANGQEVSRSTYSSLFSAIGVTYGAGNTTTTFNVPDLRGYFVRGFGTNNDGTVSGNFGEKQDDDIKPHTHTMAAGQQNGTSSGCGIDNVFQKGQDNACGTNTTSSSGATETRPKNIAMLYCIKT